MELFILCVLFVSVKAGWLEEPVAPLVMKHGYPFEEHEIETEDGYILTLHRIPHGKNNSGHVGRPVLLQHGILCSSACWLVSEPDKGLGFILADSGYDVWIPNSRGNTYSRKHRSLNPDKEPDATKFWDFSFHEMGYYDLPACIDHILGLTRHKKLHYVGHSQGTAIFFVLASTRPEYNEKIRHMSALAPVAFLDHTRGTVRALTYLVTELEIIAKVLHLHEFLADHWYIHMLERIVCRGHTFTEKICDNVLFIIAGYDSQQLNITLVPIILDYTPAGTSIKQLEHFAQIARRGDKFQQFDYGYVGNLERYHQRNPPEYDLSKITTPIMLHYASNDWLAGVKDVLKLKSKLLDSDSRLVPFHYFNHLDFMWATDVKKLLYDDMIKIMAKY
ncbi:unnamed protein product [Nezara viridula]|uniref:Lipase n=1 Tax=Nezara viridula TaxID=85310 RepID=A0A9P0MRU5_NEZVI|nr:unnamed protein product [Nezara viridula]